MILLTRSNRIPITSTKLDILHNTMFVMKIGLVTGHAPGASVIHLGTTTTIAAVAMKIPNLPHTPTTHLQEANKSTDPIMTTIKTDNATVPGNVHSRVTGHKIDKVWMSHFIVVRSANNLLITLQYSAMHCIQSAKLLLMKCLSSTQQRRLRQTSKPLLVLQHCIHQF